MNEKLFTVFQMGVVYRVSEKLNAAMEIEKELETKEEIKLGLEYFPNKKIIIRMGYSDLPASFHFGTGFKFKENIIIDFGNKYDFTLGLSSALGVLYKIIPD